MRLNATEFVSAMAIVMGAVCGASCGSDSGGSTRTQGDVQALANDVIFTVIHDGHDGLSDEHHDFIEEIVDAHDRLSDEHQQLVADFHDDELAARGMTTAHFLHELYYNPLSPEITEVMSDPKYLEIEDALHGHIGVDFDADAAMAGLQSAVPNVSGQAAALVSCTFVTVLIVAIVATVVISGIAAGTIITLSVINSNGANDFCDKCYDRAPQECPHDDSPTIVCDTQGAADTQSEGEIDETKETYKTHDSNNTGWICTFQCEDAG